MGRTVADGEGQVRRLRWDAEGRLRAIERKDDAGAFGTFTSYAYDSDDNRTREIDALTRTTVTAYDLLGRLTSITDAYLTTAFQYDAAGNVTKVIDPKAQETTYAYSSLSELTAVTQHLGQTVAYAYDARGRLARTTNARGQALVHVYEP